MRPEESRANDYLLSLDRGSVRFEPQGNVCPDFDIDREIAVEVRRLNQSYERNGKLRGLEEDRIPLIAKLQKQIEAFVPPGSSIDSHSWFISFYIKKRPIGRWNELSRRLEDFLLSFYWSDRSKTRQEISSAVSVSIVPAQVKLPTLFRLGGSGDFQQGGWVIPELIKNVQFCLTAKADGLASLSNYREKWLLLIDHIGYGRRENFQINKRGWDRVILLSPSGDFSAYEPDHQPLL